MSLFEALSIIIQSSLVLITLLSFIVSIIMMVHKKK